MVKNYKSQFVAVIIFVVCMAFAWLYPLKSVNVTLLMEFSGAEDGASAELLIDRGNGEELLARATVFSQQAQFRFDPLYYNFEKIGIRVSETGRTPALETVRAYSGEYDISKDSLICESVIGSQMQSQQQGVFYFELDSRTTDQLYNAVHQNYTIRWVLTGIFSIVFLMALLYMSKQRQKDWNKLLRYGLLIFCGIIVIYVLFNSDFNREEALNPVRLSETAVTSDDAENLPESEPELRGISLNQPIKQRFTTVFEKIQNLKLYFQPSKIEVSEEAQEKINGVIGVRLLNEDSQIVSSGVFSALEIQTTGYLELKVRESQSRLGENYSIEIVPLSGNFPADLQILAERGSFEDAQMLTVGEKAETDMVLRCDIGYAGTSRIPQIRTLVLIGLFLLLIFTVAYRKLHIKSETAALFIYLGMFAYSVGQVIFYMMYVGNTPDEAAHVSYIAYLMQTGKIIPDFSQMQMLSISGSTAAFVDGTVNQLGHPPLYYLVMTLCKPIEIIGENSFLIHFTRLRLFSAAFGLLALAIAFYIGYTRITKKQPALHLLYSAIITSVPMFLYNLCGVNNDTFALLGCVLFFLGILRVCEEKRNYATYFLIAGGLVIAVLSKVTAGMLIGLTAIIYVIWYCIKHKSIKLICCKQFLISLPVYLVAVGYFVIVYLEFHTLQPDLSSINPEYYQASPFFVNFEDRTVMSMFDYSLLYWKNFFDTWTAVAFHTSLYKLDHWTSYDRILTLLIFFVPILLFFVRKSKKYIAMLIGFYVSLAVVVWMQFQRAFETYFYVAGYTGAYQTRYYLCVLPILAFIAVYLLQMLTERKEKPSAESERCHEGMIILSPNRVAVTISIVASIGLLYSGFVYFLFNYFGY